MASKRKYIFSLEKKAIRAKVSVEEFISRTKDGLKFCNKCEFWKTSDNYTTRTDNKTDGKYTICKACVREYGMKRYRPYDSKYMYYQYKNNAKIREYNFELGLEDFEILKNLSCSYCGAINNLGYDRINSDIGYAKSNVVPCCSTCNYMKSDIPEGDWILHMTKILAFKGFIERDGR